MNEIIVITTDQLRAIINECLEAHCPPPSPTPLQIVKEPRLLHSLKELANFLNCSTVTAQKLKNSGKIRFKQFGRKCIFSSEEVLEDIGRKKFRGVNG
jgi:excisionase family DNA binding protein